MLRFSALLLLTVPVFAFAAEPRVPWTASKIVGSPEPPPPFKTVNAFPNVKLEKPTFLVPCPGSDRLFAGEEHGKVFSFPNRPDATAEPCFDITTDVKTLPAGARANRLYSMV